MLYGLLLDRMALSARNGWLDEDRRVFLYFTLEDAMAMMGCGHNKAVRLFAGLEQIGLIERRKRGRAAPPASTSRTSSCPQRPGSQRQNRTSPCRQLSARLPVWGSLRGPRKS